MRARSVVLLLLGLPLALCLGVAAASTVLRAAAVPGLDAYGCVEGVQNIRTHANGVGISWGWKPMRGTPCPISRDCGKMLVITDYANILRTSRLCAPLWLPVWVVPSGGFMMYERAHLLIEP